MDRSALIDLLARSVQDGTISEDDARQIAAGVLNGSIPSTALPLPPEEGVRALSEDDLLLAAALYASLGHPEITSWYESEVAALSRRTAALARWQADMVRVSHTHLAAQHMAGAHSESITPDSRIRLDTMARTESAYLSRFADTIAVKVLTGTPMSEPQIAARATTYGSDGYGEYFHAAETEGDPRGLGWIVDYLSQDDGSTCSECLAAEHGGPYLPGTGKFPAVVCRGRFRCRCRRVYRFDRADYERLTAERGF